MSENDVNAMRGMTLFALFWTAQAAMGAESTYDFTVCTHSRYTPLEANADIVTFGVENWGVVASSSTKFWEQASTHCVGYIRMTAGKAIGKGTCKWTEATGGTAIGEWEYPPDGAPTWTWLSGTGSLKGITGGGSFRDLFSAKPSEPGMGQGCRRDTGKYQVP